MTDKKLVEKAIRAHERSINALRRYYQYHNYPTGRKAFERYEHYEGQFTEAVNELHRRASGGF